MAREVLSAGPLWRLHCDVVSARALLWFAGAGIRGEPKPGIHLYLADRYGWLAERYAERGQVAKSRFYAAKAIFHSRQAGADGGPGTVAVAMSIPASPTRTDAVGGGADPADPDDVA